MTWLERRLDWMSVEPRSRSGRKAHLRATSLFQRLTTRPLDPGFRFFGNYPLRPELLSKDSVVYSFGVYDDVRFESALIGELGCTVHAFDPNPVAVEFMARAGSHPNIVYTPKGVWTRAGVEKFYGRGEGHGGNSSFLDLYGEDRYTEVECDTLEGFRRTFGHDHLDVLKLDIQGAAIPVLEQLLTTDLRPPQIVSEFEIIKVDRLFPMLRRVRALVRSMEAAGYQAFHFNLSRKSTVELVFLRRS